MRILHVLANGPPDVNGYAIRTHALLQAQAETGEITPVGLTSPWYPERMSMCDNHQQDGIRYLRTLHPVHDENRNGVLNGWLAGRGRKKIARQHRSRNSVEQKRSITKRITDASKFVLRRTLSPGIRIVNMGLGWLDEKVLFRRFRARIIEVAETENAELIHAHTPYRVGVPAQRAARELGLPFVYEMRGMWEETAVASGRWRAGGIAHRRFRRLETKLLKRADAVICISQTLQEEAISRGVNPARITVVANAVGIMPTPPVQVDCFEEVKAKLGGAMVVGYIGSLRWIEGVDQTAEAVAIIRSQGVDVKLFVLSSEPGQADLIAHCKHLGIAEHAVIFGPVPHENVTPFYDLIDVFVVSRPDTRVTRLVTPLKPFEAMQRGRALVMPDLPALAEIIENGRTGRLYPADDLMALTSTIRELLENENERGRLGDEAKVWVESNRTWASVIEPIPQLYREIISAKSQ